VTGSGGVNIIDTSELEEFLGDGGTNNTSSSGGGDELASDGSSLTVNLGGDGMDSTNLVTPISSSDGDEGELGSDKGSLNGNLDFLSDLDSETDVTVVITDGNEGLEAGTLSGLGLLLDGDDLHDLILESSLGTVGVLDLGNEFLNDLSLLDWDSVSVDLFEGRNVSVHDESSELGLGGPFFLSGTTTAAGTASATSTSSKSSSLLTTFGGACGCSFSHSAFVIYLSPALHGCLFLGGEDDTVVLLLEPLHRVLLGDAVVDAHAALPAPAVRDVEAGAAEHHVEVEAVDADAGVVLDAQIDVLLDAEPEVARVGEVALAQLVLAHLEAALEDLLGLGAAHRAVDGDLLVTSDAEAAHRVAGLGEDGRLARQLLQHLGRASQPGPCCLTSVI